MEDDPIEQRWRVTVGAGVTGLLLVSVALWALVVMVGYAVDQYTATAAIDACRAVVTK